MIYDAWCLLLCRIFGHPDHPSLEALPPMTPWQRAVVAHYFRCTRCGRRVSA